jgi:radical SAM/Cys-rich protein
MRLFALFAVGTLCFARAFKNAARTTSSSRTSRNAQENSLPSLVESTLEGIQSDALFLQTEANLKTFGQKKLTLDERKARHRSLGNLGIPSFSGYLKDRAVSISRKSTKILQLNIGLYCNQACNHCHVESSPRRTEHMTLEVAAQCMAILDKSPTIDVVDLTGGAPELNPSFRFLVTEARKRNKQVIDRCNLTVLLEPGQEDLPEFLATNKVRVVASLPCYSESNVDKQRGKGVFGRSILALQLLNSKGYGMENSDLKLDLVYNPSGGSLPPSQKSLEVDYKKRLFDDYGIQFNSLLTITNMPIKRFADFLLQKGELDSYMELLVNNFNPAAAEGVMCRDTLSVGYDGKIYDCDFNQQLQLSLGKKLSSLIVGEEVGDRVLSAKTVFDLDSAEDLINDKIVTDSHCFGCTAGAGSSCQGSTI